MLSSSRPMRSKAKIRLISLAGVMVGLILGGMAFDHHRSATGSVAPALTTADSKGADSRSLQLHLQQIVASKLKTREADHISIYFRDLGSDSAFGIGEDYQFSPASLMKVPVMIAHLKRAEKNPDYLQDKILFTGGADYTGIQGFKPLLTIQKGQTYTIDELIHRMISFSDNNALSLLLQHIDKKDLFKVLTDLHVDYVPTKDGGLVSLKNYANFFQALYSGTYLNQKMSAHALHFLAQEEFKQGICAGVPQGTTVAAKFGEWAKGAHSEMRTLQEVGIVYSPEHPYLLGIETEGLEIDKLTSVIREISHEVYAGVNTNKSRRKSS